MEGIYYYHYTNSNTRTVAAKIDRVIIESYKDGDEQIM